MTTRESEMRAAVAFLAIVVAGCNPAEPPTTRGALCVDGHPAKRRENVTYGGLLPRHGYVRDHIIPLCLGGADTSENVQYQTHSAGHAKDRSEYEMCEAYCAGRI